MNDLELQRELKRELTLLEVRVMAEELRRQEDILCETIETRHKDANGNWITRTRNALGQFGGDSGETKNAKSNTQSTSSGSPSKSSEIELTDAEIDKMGKEFLASTEMLLKKYGKSDSKQKAKTQEVASSPQAKDLVKSFGDKINNAMNAQGINVNKLLASLQRGMAAKDFESIKKDIVDIGKKAGYTFVEHPEIIFPVIGGVVLGVYAGAFFAGAAAAGASASALTAELASTGVMETTLATLASEGTVMTMAELVALYEESIAMIQGGQLVASMMGWMLTGVGSALYLDGLQKLWKNMTKDPKLGGDPKMIKKLQSDVSSMLKNSINSLKSEVKGMVSKKA